MTSTLSLFHYNVEPLYHSNGFKASCRVGKDHRKHHVGRSSKTAASLEALPVCPGVGEAHVEAHHCKAELPPADRTLIHSELQSTRMQPVCTHPCWSSGCVSGTFSIEPKGKRWL